MITVPGTAKPAANERLSGRCRRSRQPPRRSKALKW